MGGNPGAYKRRAQMGRGINGGLIEIQTESAQNLREAGVLEGAGR